MVATFFRNSLARRQFGLPELARVARRYGTHLLFTVGGEEADNANWSRLASNEKQRELLASDLTVMSRTRAIYANSVASIWTVI
ncbi:hypothetical protein HPB48_004431 [Haemaphysalis longicornis]|uniref:Uncharacterized protein n=1 Tax=Haemaphysalis longicornis TaxID=44386 RepID=A0A9J6FFK8_HAELO|nr:hypothetical protein HPB48_004431 [Haemaphysalis longicornis]